MDYAIHNVQSYQHMQGKEQKAHLGSQSKGHSNDSTRYSTGTVGSGGTHPMDRSMTAY